MNNILSADDTYAEMPFDLNVLGVKKSSDRNACDDQVRLTNNGVTSFTSVPLRHYRSKSLFKKDIKICSYKIFNFKSRLQFG